MMLLARSNRARLKVWGQFSTPEECAALIDLARPRLHRSTVLDRASGGSAVQDVRTSQGAYLSKDETPLVRDITTRAAGLLDVPRDHIEPLQVIRYGVGDKYSPHNDWFDPNDPGSASVLSSGGQRIKTLLLYLNTPEAGGATSFPDAEHAVCAVAGNAVSFEYPNASHADLCLHGGDPVEAGEKWAVNVWARRFPYGTPAPVSDHGVFQGHVFNAEDCARLRQFYDSHSDRAEGGLENAVRAKPGELVDFIARVKERVDRFFPEPKVVETVVLARMCMAMGNHADNVKWNGTSFEPNHTPNRTHTAVTFLNDGDGITHYGDNPVSPWSLDITPKEGHAHIHRCGPDFHHRVSAPSSPRYSLVVWFKSP